MDDLISRQALIEHLRRTIEASSNDGDYNEGFNDGMDFAACFASTLPSAQPERKTGEWITHYYKLGTERYECNVCHNRIGDTPYYCPNCGADMRGKQDE